MLSLLWFNFQWSITLEKVLFQYVFKSVYTGFVHPKRILVIFLDICYWKNFQDRIPSSSSITSHWVLFPWRKWSGAAFSSIASSYVLWFSYLLTYLQLLSCLISYFYFSLGLWQTRSPHLCQPYKSCSMYRSRTSSQLKASCPIGLVYMP